MHTMLSPRQLQIFVAIGQSLSFSRTAQEMHITQSRLSRAVKEIEGEIGVSLFERTTRRVSLTESGQALLVVARRIVEEYERGLLQLQYVASGQSCRVGIAALPTITALLLPEPIADLRREFPNSKVDLRDVNASAAIDLLRARKVDLAITSIDGNYTDLKSSPLLRDNFVLVTKAEFITTPQLDWNPEKINQLSIISMPKGSSTREIIDAHYVGSGIPFCPAFEVSCTYTISKMVMAGCGVALLPRLVAEMVVTPGLSIISIIDSPTRTIEVVTRSNEPLPELASCIANKVQALTNNLVQQGIVKH